MTRFFVYSFYRCKIFYYDKNPDGTFHYKLNGKWDETQHNFDEFQPRDNRTNMNSECSPPCQPGQYRVNRKFSEMRIIQQKKK